MLAVRAATSKTARIANVNRGGMTGISDKITKALLNVLFAHLRCALYQTRAHNARHLAARRADFMLA